MRLKSSLIVAAALTVASSSASAVRQPTHMKERPHLEAADGSALRTVRMVEQRPRERRSAWSSFLARAGGQWQGMWDADTQVPLRIWGSGIAAPGSVASAEVAERYARQYLELHLELLAPGATAADFEIAGNQAGNGLRAVGFSQRHGGVPVLGGQVSFLFKHDRLIVIGSEAVPDVSVSAATARVGKDIAAARAHAWVARDAGSDAQVVATKDAVIVPLIQPGRGPAGIRYVTAFPVTVAGRSQLGTWNVYVDAATGNPVARKQLLRFASGQLRYDVPDRWPQGIRSVRPAAHATVTVNGASATTDAGGVVIWAGTASASVTASVLGPYARIANMAGDGLLATFSGTLRDGSTLDWLDAAADEVEDAQLTTFLFSNIANANARVLNPRLAWLDEPITARVNRSEEPCNAFYDGSDGTINFHRGISVPGTRCNNSGRVPDIVLHEYGHALHVNSLIWGVAAFDRALSEGIGDYFAVTFTGDPGMGRGFFLDTEEPVRHLDPPDSEARWPDDIDDQSEHTTGLIFGGAMWDLRKELIAALGQEQGRRYADKLFYAVLQTASDIPSSYTSVLAADDDDGDLANGTPLGCVIERAFARHALSQGSLPPASPVVMLPQRDGLQVSLTYSTPAQAVCPTVGITGATLEWRIRGDDSQGGSLPMTAAATTFAATMPTPEQGVVMQYRIVVQLENGLNKTFPANPADPYYELFMGDVTPIACTDFESDPSADGWGTTSNSDTSDWNWDSPRGAAGDPDQAYSGTYVVGTNLSGAYAPNTTSELWSPSFDVSGFGNVRLQYRRWLTVQDGMYDQAIIYANEEPVWTNAMGQEPGSTLEHTDREWCFHDIDLTEYVSSNTLRLRFAMHSDDAGSLGGWNIDDLCLVSVSGSTCGNRVVDGGEQCDDGNDVAGDGCSSACLLEPAINGGSGGGCACQAGTRASSLSSSLSSVALAGLVLLALGALLRRRRRAR